MNPLVIIIISFFVLAVAAGGWMLGTLRQMHIRKEEMEDAAKTLRICSDAFNSLGLRWGKVTGVLVEAKEVLEGIKGTKKVYNELPLELKTRIDLLLKKKL